MPTGCAVDPPPPPTDPCDYANPPAYCSQPKPCNISTGELNNFFTANSVKTDVENKLIDMISKYGDQFGLINKYAVQQFLAQVDDESWGLTRMIENTSSNRAKKLYGYNPILGNTHPGDGVKYIGEGILQITGRYLDSVFTHYYNNVWLQKNPGFGSEMNFIKNPELIGSTPKIAVLSGLWIFKRKMHLYGIGNIDGNTSVTRVSQAINGSDHKPPNGLAARRNAFKEAQSIIKECK